MAQSTVLPAAVGCCRLKHCQSPIDPGTIISPCRCGVGSVVPRVDIGWLQTFRLRNFKSFQYGVYRQQYLELIERQVAASIEQ